MRILILSVLLLLTNISFSQSYLHLFELRGIEDSLGNTHLFYRYGYYGYQGISCWQKNIYHFDITNNTDTLFILDYGVDPIGNGCEGQFINDYEFFDNNPAKYFYGGYDYYIDPAPILQRYDGAITLPVSTFGGITEIEISEQNDSLIYVSLNNLLLKSTDGGYNFTFNEDSLAFIDNALISLSHNNDKQIYGIDQNKLVRSEDEGQSYIIVDDDSHWGSNFDKELYYDADAQHIYSVSTSSNESALLISNSNGDPFTWNLRLTAQGMIWFTLNEQNPGEIYYSARKKIFKSTDFGSTFILYRELDRKITGLYKKSGSNILYASTPFKIFEITPDSTQIIKFLPIPDEVLNLYPLKVGNRWVYDEYTFSEGNNFHDIFSREVTGDSLLPNGIQYYLVEEHADSAGFTNYSFERIDSSTGLVYRYYEDPALPESEYLIDDLLAEVGDTIWSSREFYDPDLPTVLIQQREFNKWGLKKPRIIYQHQGLGLYTHSLTRDIGLDSIGYHFDFGNTDIILKGCIVDGVVYGDTTVVSVEDETPNIPTKFYLSQNYPNPFNPSTKIKFTIPKSPLPGGDGRGGLQLVKLVVYDILGNEVATLVNEEKPAGEYEVEFNGKGLPSGIYFYQLRAGSFVDTKKMLLIK